MNPRPDPAQLNAPDDGIARGGVLLDVKNVSLSFGGVKAITNISFDIRKGEIRAIPMPDSSVRRQSSMSACSARAFSRPRCARTRSPRRRARMIVSVALWKRVNSTSPEATSVRCGLRGRARNRAWAALAWEGVAP